MKKLIITSLILALISCKKESQESFGKTEETTTEGEASKPQTPQQLGQTIFEGKGNCTSCHQIDSKTIGPSIKEISKIYKEKNSNIVQFLKGEGTPIIDPSQYEIMKANFVITKGMTDEELKAIETYIYSN
jgi:cytochrome c